MMTTMVIEKRRYGRRTWWDKSRNEKRIPSDDENITDPLFRGRRWNFVWCFIQNPRKSKHNAQHTHSIRVISYIFYIVQYVAIVFHYLARHIMQNQPNRLELKNQGIVPSSTSFHFPFPPAPPCCGLFLRLGS